MSRALFDHLATLNTEQRNARTGRIDTADAVEIATLINEQDQTVAAAVQARIPAIAVAIDRVAASIGRGGRLIYAGAGTSGRIGVVDAAECPPTFGTDPSTVVGLMAGGNAAMFRAQEGAEDSESLGRQDIAALETGPDDVVCGLAASGRTPYVWGAMDEAAARGAFTVLICCVDVEKLPERRHPDLVIDLITGPEVIMGSTRMKAGTAQKMTCNMITTGAMVRLGKVYENVMVDLKLTNAKLVERAVRIIMMFTRLEYAAAKNLLNEAAGHVKTALVMHQTGLDAAGARQRLDQAGGFIYNAIHNPILE